MHGASFLVQAALFLAAAAVAAPLAKRLGVGSVLGYLGAGIVLGPYGLGFVVSVYEAESILHIAEFGVVLLLFLIGLELRPARLWAMRGPVFGLGAAQVASAAGVLALLAWFAGLPGPAALVAGYALALSSTAFVLQILEEKGELRTRHGRYAFAILLFQDLAAIPFLALVPLLGDHAGSGLSLLAVVKAAAAIAVVFLAGRFLLRRLYPFVAATGVKEAMTASALLTVVLVALLMEAVGLSAALGAFLAGALLAESAYRHEIEADIAPFEGLLLGLFFVAVGLSLHLGVVVERPFTVLGIVLGLVAVKAALLLPLGRWWGLPASGARRLALALAQGGEFAFVLVTAALATGVLGRAEADLLNVAVTLSMALTPLLLIADEALARRTEQPEPPFEEPEQQPVIIAGFGRFGQIVARVLRAKRIPFTALDASSEQIDFVARYGNKVYYGDASRLDLLRAASADKARALVLAIDDVEASVKVAELARTHFPNLPIYARARNRQHAFRLMDAGVRTLQRETFLSALDLARELLEGLGSNRAEAQRAVLTFRAHDEKRLRDDHAHWTDEERVRLRARKAAEELEEMFARDAAADAAPQPGPTAG
jgi:monovalent cation:proton antiporter-2 (CPA2) family protein